MPPTPDSQRLDYVVGQLLAIQAVVVAIVLAGKDLAGTERFAARKRAVELLNEQEWVATDSECIRKSKLQKKMQVYEEVFYC